jgi:hypothetical protein
MFYLSVLVQSFYDLTYNEPLFADNINYLWCLQVLSNDIDLLHPPAELEKRKHKLKRLVQSPNSFFMVLSSVY